MRWPTQKQKQITFDRLNYVPYPEQKQAHTSTTTVLQIVGAEGAGKSQIVSNEVTACVPWCKLIYLIGETYDNPRKEFEYLRDNLIRLGVLRLNNISTPGVGKWQLTTDTGCHIETLSSQQGASAVIATGEEPDIFVLCEAGIIGSYSLFTACVRRATRSDGRVILVGTLKDNFGWYASLMDELSVIRNLWRGETISLPAWINKSLYPGGEQDPEIQRLKKILPADEYARTIAAQKVNPPALIFNEFSYSTYVRPCPFDPQLDVHLWIDPGYYPSAYACLPVQYHGDEVWQIDEVYLNHHTHKQVIDVCKSREWWSNVNHLAGDIATRQHQATDSAVEIWLQETGLYIHSQTISIQDGIDRHRSFLNPPRLFHDPSCVGTLSEYKQYRRRTDRDGNPTSDDPIDKHNHAMKAIAYGLIDQFGRVDGWTVEMAVSPSVYDEPTIDEYVSVSKWR